MKKLFTLVIATMFAALLSAQTVPNGGFETWTDGEPDEWSTSNLPGYTTITQSDDSHSGNSAIRGSSVEKDNENIIPEIECDGGGTGAGFPVDQDYSILKFWLKFDDGNNDHLEVYISMRDADFQTIALGTINIEEKYETWDQVVIPIDYDGEGAAYCAIQILMTGGLGEPSLDSWFIIDDMELFTGVGESEKLSMDGINIYPNPAAGNFSISIPENAQYEDMQVFDQVGKLVYSQPLEQNDRKITLSQSWEAGLYFIMLKGDGIVETRKIIIK